MRNLELGSDSVGSMMCSKKHSFQFQAGSSLFHLEPYAHENGISPASNEHFAATYQSPNDHIPPRCCQRHGNECFAQRLELLISPDLMELVSKSLGKCPDLGGIIATLCRRLPKLDTKALVMRLRTMQSLQKLVQSSMELKHSTSKLKSPIFTEMFQVRRRI